MPTFTDNLSGDALSEIERHATQHHFEKGGDIIHKGQEIGGIYIVKSGVLRVYTIDAGGNEKPIYHLNADEVCVFSINCVLKEIVYPAWVRVESETATVLSLPTMTFRDLYEREFPVREYIVNALSDRIFDLMSSIEENSVYEIPHRISNYLLRHCPNGGILEFSHQDIANSLGTAREVVSRHLKKLERDGYLKLSRRKIEILSPEKLAKTLKDTEL